MHYTMVHVEPDPSGETSEELRDRARRYRRHARNFSNGIRAGIEALAEELEARAAALEAAEPSVELPRVSTSPESSGDPPCAKPEPE